MDFRHQHHRRTQSGFTLVELLVVISIIALLAGLLMPAISAAKSKANRVDCLNNVKQLVLSLHMYADDYQGYMPPRDYQSGEVWVDRLKSYYQNDNLLRCPADRGTNRSTYLMNGFIDLLLTQSFSGNTDDFFGAYKTGGFEGVKWSTIPFPSETISVGERLQDSDDDSYMDIWPPPYGSDHLTEVDHGKHTAAGGFRAGGSNFGFADGSARFLKYGDAFIPKNLWAVTESFRNAELPEL